MFRQIIAVGALLSVTACSSMDHSTYSRGTPGVTEEMVAQQEAEDQRLTNAAFSLLMAIMVVTLLNNNGGGFVQNGQILPP